MMVAMPDDTLAPDGSLAEIAYRKGADGIPEPALDPIDDPILPASPVNLVCQVGPCRSYTELLTDSPDLGEGRQLSRYCRRLSVGSELMELTDAVVFACNAYQPPWWSLSGWAWRRQQLRTLADARRQITAACVDDDEDDGGDHG